MSSDPKLPGLRRWYDGDKTATLRFSDLWRLLLIQVWERAIQALDEERQPLPKGKNEYSYDLVLVAEHEGIWLSVNDARRIGSYYSEHGWGKFLQRMPVKIVLTDAGKERAEYVFEEIDRHTIKRANNDSFNDENSLDLKLAPAAGRFVRLDDNSQEFADAIVCLEELIQEAGKIRINTWPEKEGVIASLDSALTMLRTKYVNKNAIATAVLSATTFIILKFAETPIADLATRTWNAIKSLF